MKNHNLVSGLCTTSDRKLGGAWKQELQISCFYSHTDDIIRFQQLPSRQVPHYHARNGELYALPDRANQQTADIEDTFDGECYASTYQTKGKIHTYHELSETSRRTSLFSRTSTQVSTMSIPSLPPSPELIENPHAAQFPYVEVESQPIASQPVSYAQPVTRRVSAPTFPYVEPVIPRVCFCVGPPVSHS